MYSLYRAWLSLGPCGGMSGLGPTMPLPGNSLGIAAPVQFTGSPDVSLQVGPTMTQFSAHRTVLCSHSGYFKAALSNHSEQGPIAVPNVNVDEFSSLLTFMYSGYLDLNVANIYNILLATHILHMPRALELCRSFLMHSQPLEARTHLIKPIPSRKSALPHQQIFPPVFSDLQKSEATPFRAIATNERHQREVVAYPSTSKVSNDPGPARKEHGNQHRTRPSGLEKNKRKQEKANDKTVVDIACCDGPVRFHRVLNKNYGMGMGGGMGMGMGMAGGSENDYHMEEVDRNGVMNKVMSESIRDKQLSDENQSQTGSSDVFTCMYCNHTFKSQYCYQKHARRHLNPVSLDPTSVQQVESSAAVKREVKLLDMNVQYYPCKTCGSKFPSYYFVHKHRKMCHADEMADSNNKNNEIEVENNCNTNDSKNSVIDVETEESK